jgi:hypothetical protein
VGPQLTLPRTSSTVWTTRDVRRELPDRRGVPSGKPLREAGESPDNPAARRSYRSKSMVSADSIIAAMWDVRPGRFYSVDELAAVLRTPDKAALHEQLRIMAGDPDIQSPFKLLQGSSDDFYRRVSVAPALTLCERWGTNAS